MGKVHYEEGRRQSSEAGRIDEAEVGSEGDACGIDRMSEGGLEEESFGELGGGGAAVASTDSRRSTTSVAMAAEDLMKLVENRQSKIGHEQETAWDQRPKRIEASQSRSLDAKLASLKKELQASLDSKMSKRVKTAGTAGIAASSRPRRKQKRP